MLNYLSLFFLQLDYFEKYDEKSKWEEFISNKDLVYSLIIIILLFALIIFIGLYSKEKKSNSKN